MFGLLTPAEAELLAGLRSTGTTCVALLIDTTTWLNLPTAARAEADPAHEAAALALLRGGWRVVGVEHGAELRRAVAAGRPRFAGLRLAGRDGRDGAPEESGSEPASARHASSPPAATMLAALPLSTVFETWTWLLEACIGVAAIVGAADRSSARCGPRLGCRRWP